MKRIPKSILAGLLIAGSLFSRPYFDEAMNLTQPDGSVVPVIMNGDEFYQHVTSPDGYTLTQGTDGWIRYATVNSDSSAYIPGEVYRLGTSARSALPSLIKGAVLNETAILNQVRTMKKQLGVSMLNATIDPSALRAIPAPENQPSPSVGNINGLTICIDFSDRPATMALSEIDQMINGDNFTKYGNACSIKEWFSKTSEGKLTYTNTVVGYYRAQKPFSYYDDASVPYGTRDDELCEEALKYLESTGFDFSQLSDVRGMVPLNIYYSGYRSGTWAKGLWPHMGGIYSEDGVTGGVTAGGKKFIDFQITDIGEDLSIGTFIHENGHMLLYYPDLYPYSTGTNWVRGYCTMSSGSSGPRAKNPTPYNPYFRELSGWTSPADLAGTPNTIVTAVPSELGDVKKYARNGGAEMYYFDARKGTGLSATLPSEGLIVWKIDTAGTNANTALNKPMVQIIDADNNSAYGEAGDYFVNVPGTALSSPRSNWYDGTSSGLMISNVSPFGSTMTYQLGTGGTGTTYTVTASQNIPEAGTISPSGKTAVLSGGSLNYTFTENSGYVLDSVTVDNQRVTLAGMNYTILDVTSNKTLKAWYSTTTNIKTVNTTMDSKTAIDSLIVLDTSLIGNGDTLVTKNYSLFITDSTFFTTDSLLNGMIFWSGVDTIVKVDTLTQITADTLFAGGVAILEKKRPEMAAVIAESNPVPASAPAVTFTLPENSVRYKIIILDVTGNAVFQNEGECDRIRWDLTNNQGSRVCGSFRVIVQIVDGSGTVKAWDSILGVQK